MRRDFMIRLAPIVVAACALCGCKQTTPETPPPTQTTSVTITITAAGANPRDVTISVGQRVLFINNDTRSHNMTSDPHPEHDICPDINQAGFLQPGQRRETGNMVVARTCGFHDHDDPDTLSLHGTITIK